MTQYVINIGAIPNDGTGDPLRTAFNETNLNFDQVFAAGPVLSNIQIANNKILTTNTNGNLVLAPNGTGVVQSNVSIVPNLANIRNLGSSTQRWATVYTQYLNVSAGTSINGDLSISGNLTIQGNIIEMGNIVTDALTIQLANTATTTVAANGAGITVGANDNIATLLYNSTGNIWATNIGVSAVGNITAPYFFGNGSQLTGLAPTYGNANVATLLANFGSNTISTTGNITGNIVAPGSNGQVLYNRNGAVGTSAFDFTYQESSNTLFVKTGSFVGDTTSGIDALYAGVESFTVLGSAVMAQFTGNVQNYSQVNFQNSNDSRLASGDYIITADNGNDTTHFIDLGMTSSNWDGDQDNSLGTLLTPNTGYLYVQDGNLILGTKTGSTARVWIFDTAGNLTVPGNIIPVTSNAYSLGNATNQWSDLYVSNATIYINNVPISLTAGNVLTVNGNSVVTATANDEVVASTFATSNSLSIPVAGGSGDKIRLYDFNNANTFNYAVGVESGNMWFGVDAVAPNIGFNFYGGNTVAAHIDSTGNISANYFVGNGAGLFGNVTMNSQWINNLSDPTEAQDAATKYYVDTVAQGLHVHTAAYLGTTTDLATYTGATVAYAQPAGVGNGVGATLSFTGNTLTALDGVSLVGFGSNTRLLVKNEGNAVYNGVYTYTSNTVLTRATDSDIGGDFDGGDFIFVQAGSTQADTGWVQTTENVVIGTSNIVFTQFSGAGTGAQLVQSNSPPASPSSQTLWWDEVSGRLYLYYNDGSTSNWIDASPAAVQRDYSAGNNLVLTGNVFSLANNVSITGNVNATAFVGDGSQLTGVANPTMGAAQITPFVPPTTSVTVPASSSNVNITTDTILVTNTFVNGQAVTYNANGGTVMGGLGDGRIYYIGNATGTSFQLYDNAKNALLGGTGGRKNISGLGNNLQTFSTSSVSIIVNYDMTGGNTVFVQSAVANTVTTINGDFDTNITSGQALRVKLFIAGSGTDTDFTATSINGNPVTGFTLTNGIKRNTTTNINVTITNFGGIYTIYNG